MFSPISNWFCQVGYTSGFVIEAGVHVNTAAKDHATQRNIVRIVVGPPERFPETQSGRYPPESTRVAAGISGELHRAEHLLFDYGGVVEQVRLQALADNLVYALLNIGGVDGNIRSDTS